MPEDLARFPIGGSATASWREETLVRAIELQFLANWLETREDQPGDVPEGAFGAVERHLDAAIAAAEQQGGRWPWDRLLRSLTGADIERASANLDAAETELLRVAPLSYVRGVLPELEARVSERLPIGDPRRLRVEQLAQRAQDSELTLPEREALVGAVRAARLEQRRYMTLVRSFRNVLIVATVALTVVAIALAIVGAIAPATLPLCFEFPGAVTCPTGTETGQGLDAGDVAGPWDIALVELLGLLAAAVTASVSLRGATGTSAPFSMPIALVAIKLPTGALTAVIGILLLRSDVIPGFGALRTPAEIFAWALAFGAAQQLLTRQVDRNAAEVLGQAGDIRAPAHGTAGPSVEEIEQAVSATLRAKLSAPRLINYRGFLSARLREPDGSPVPQGENGRFIIDHCEAGHTLEVVIGPEAQPEAVSAPLVIEEGDPAPSVPFTIEVEADDSGARTERSVDVAAAEAATLVTFPLEIPHEASDSFSFWLRVEQAGRLVQILELEVLVPA